MKIAQVYHNNRLCLGTIEGEGVIPLDFSGDMMDLIKNEPRPQPLKTSPLLDHIIFAPPITNPSKIICLGLNYMDHVRESKGRPPENPLIFAKFPNSLIGHNDLITWNKSLTRKVDFEAELAVIIGKEARDCSEIGAEKIIFGYTCANDISARDLQFGDGQWVRGKSLDTFCPLGPFIVTRDEIPDPHSLSIQCRLNGSVMQDSNTREMIFNIPEIISFCSRHFTLMPGDIILTGTPNGVGAFRNPSIYLKDGDEVEVEIQQIGRLTNRCRVI